MAMKRLGGRGVWFTSRTVTFTRPLAAGVDGYLRRPAPGAGAGLAGDDRPRIVDAEVIAGDDLDADVGGRPIQACQSLQ